MTESEKQLVESVPDSSTQMPEGKYLTRREWVIVIGLVIGALAIRLLALTSQPMITGDGVWYATLGKKLISGDFQGGLSTYWPPLYPLLIGLTSLIFPNPELAGTVVSMLTGSLLVIPTYLLTRSSYGRNAAILSGIMVLFYPSLVAHSIYVLTEIPYTFFFCLAVVAGWWALTGGRRIGFFVTGLIFGACYLIRPEGIGFAGLMVILALGASIFDKQAKVAKATLNASLVILGFMLVSLPYLLYLRHETGGWTISAKLSASIAAPARRGDNIWRGLVEGETTTLADRLWAGNRSSNQVIGVDQNSSAPSTTAPSLGSPFSRLRSILPNRDRLKRIFKRLLEVVLLPFLLFTCVGLFRTIWSRRRAGKEVYLLSFLLATLIGYSATPVFEDRYLIPLLPLFFSWSAKGVLELQNWLIGSVESIRGSGAISSNLRRLVKIGMIIILLVSMLPSLAQIIKSKGSDPTPVVKWIQADSPTPPTIMASNPWPAFYTGGKHLYLPDESYSRFIEYARGRNVDYIVVEETAIGVTPQLKSLLDNPNESPGLTLVYSNETVPGRVLVYKLSDLPTSPVPR